MTEMERRSLETLRAAIAAAGDALCGAQVRMAHAGDGRIAPLPSLPCEVGPTLACAAADIQRVLDVVDGMLR